MKVIIRIVKDHYHNQEISTGQVVMINMDKTDLDSEDDVITISRYPTHHQECKNIKKAINLTQEVLRLLQKITLTYPAKEQNSFLPMILKSMISFL